MKFDQNPDPVCMDPHWFDPWIRIRIEVKSWIRIRISIETHADPQQSTYTDTKRAIPNCIY